MDNGLVVGTLLSGTRVDVYDLIILYDTQSQATVWYYVAMLSVQGWVMGDKLDAATCPQQQLFTPSASFAEIEETHDQQQLVATATAIVAAASSAPIDAIPTATPVPASGDVQADVVGSALLTCALDSREVLMLYQDPSVAVPQTLRLDAGTLVQVIGLSDVWYWVRIIRPDGSEDGGFVRADALALPSACNPLNLPSVPIPGDLEADVSLPAPELDPALAVPPTVVPPAQPQLTPYTVQPGDTLLSILARFNLPRETLPEILLINGLTEDMRLTAGSTLLLPTRQPLADVTFCQIVSKQSLDVHLQPTDESSVIAVLPPGTELQVGNQMQQPGVLWLSVSAQVEGVSISGGWVRAEALDFITDCSMNPANTHVLPLTLIPVVPTVPPPSPTATPVR
jgi:hypothetical protein